MMISSLLTSIGLACDILGALILAVPDVSLLAQLFEFGRLRRAREKMEAEGVQRGEVGFKSLVREIEEIDPVEEASADDIGDELMEIAIEQRGGFSPSDINFNWGEEYVEARYEPNCDWNEADILDTGKVYRRIRSEVESTSTRVRVTGLGLLAGGFSLQLVANLV
jgi:hypothetical protein